MRTIAINEILRATTIKNSNSTEFIYSPNYSTKVKEEFYKRRFAHIKVNISNAIFIPNKNVSTDKSDIVFCWDAWDEKAVYKNKIAVDSQNRLFSDFKIEGSKSFSHFRKIAEKKLPDYYEEAIKPFDEELQGRLQHYFYESLCPSTYFETRNGMVNEDDSSRFSEYLACGALDVRCLYNEIKDYEKRNGGNKSTYWLIFELLWREFFYWHYQNWERAYFSLQGINSGLDFSKFETYNIDELRLMSQHPFWQASLTELEETGYQTNRTRQLFASFWTHELKLDWRSGARLFQLHLIDYDVYSNWGNWMYIAGVGASSRGERKFNVNSQIDRYDPNKKYYSKWNS